MGEAYFYHVTRRPLPQTLRTLVERARGNGWRVAVRGPDAGALAALDAALWEGPPETFLAHGIAGGPHDAHQPVLLTAEREAANAPDCLMSVGGAEVTAAEVAAHARVCILFDGGDEAATARARAQWRALKEAGAAAQYWSEESGTWEMKSRTG